MLRVHAARLGYLCQEALGEVQTLLRLTELLPQVAHVDLEHFEASVELVAGWTLPEVLGPPRERQGEPRVHCSMQRLALPDREADRDDVDRAQGDRDPIPCRWLENHGEILFSPLVGLQMTRASECPRAEVGQSAAPHQPTVYGPLTDQARVGLVPHNAVTELTARAGLTAVR